MKREKVKTCRFSKEITKIASHPILVFSHLFPISPPINLKIHFLFILKVQRHIRELYINELELQTNCDMS